MEQHATQGGPHVVQGIEHVSGIDNGVIIVLQNIIGILGQFPDKIRTKDGQGENNHKQKSYTQGEFRFKNHGPSKPKIDKLR
jgi:hypothetical protein